MLKVLMFADVNSFLLTAQLHTVKPASVLKGKAVPLQAWSGPEGSRNLRFPDFMTTAWDGG
jgi:hypothetical protein